MNSEPTRILLVEDDESYARYLGMHLEEIGCRVIGRADNGPDAIRLAEELRPELVIMDVVLRGDMDGIEAADAIRRRRGPPILFLSAYSEETLLARARGAAPHAYLTKPFSERELRLTIELALDRHVREQELERRMAERASHQVASETRYRQLVEAIPDAVFLIDPDHMRFLDVNAAACAGTGFTRETLLEMGPHDLMPFFNRPRLVERFQRLLDGDPEARCIETVHKRRDDSMFPVEIALRPFQLETQWVIVAVARDITERRRVESRLREAEGRFRQLAESIDEVFWIRDLLEDRFLYVSPAYETITGKTIATLLRNPRSFLGAVHPEDRARAEAVNEAEIREGLPVDGEFRLVRPDGETRWLWVKTFPIRDHRGKVYRSAGICKDVTQRRQAEERYRSILQSSMDGFWELDFDGRILEVNEAYCRLSGYTRDELLQLRVYQIEAQETQEETQRHIRSLIAAGHGRFESQHRRKDGSVFDVEVSVYTHGQGESGRFYSFFRDVTDRNRRDRELRESEERFRVALRNSRVVVFNQDRQLRYTWIYNPALGYRSEEVIGRTDADIFPNPDDARMLSALKQGVITTGQPLEQEVCVQGQHGPLHYDLNIEPMRESDGRIVGVTCSALDITEIKHREELLRLNEERFRLLFEHSPIGIALVSPDYRLAQVNQALCEMLGYTESELQRLTFIDITHPDDLASDLEQAKRLFAGEISSYRLSKRYLRKDGSLVWIQMTATIIRGRHGEPLYGVGLIENISERVLAEEERLAHEVRQRDALVREVHHRIKNNLQGVIGLLRQHALERPELGGAVDKAIAQINTISLVHGLQGRLAGSQPSLWDLLVRIARSVADLAMRPEALQLQDQSDTPTSLDDNAAVPIALILNELIQNAFKHCRPGGLIQVRLEGGAQENRLIIANDVSNWPVDFDFDKEMGFNTGLGLVKTLLPRHGANLNFERAGDRASTTLTLRPPVTLRRRPDPEPQS